jgi:hypothetical protein
MRMLPTGLNSKLPRVKREKPGHRDQPDLPGHKGQRVTREIQVHREYRGYKDLPDLPGQLDPRDLPGQRVLRAPQALRDRKEYPEYLVHPPGQMVQEKFQPV